MIYKNQWELDLVEAVNYLVFKGHRLLDVYEYTYKQVTTLYALAQKTSIDELKNLASATRTAYHADESQYKRFLK